MSTTAQSEMGRNSSLESALEDATARYRARTPKSQVLYDAACEALPGGNTRSVLFYPPYPVSIEKGDGIDVWDVDANHYTDFLAEYSAGLYGHSHPKIQAAVRSVLDSGFVLCAPNHYEGELASILCERFASCERVRFTNSGTEGNLMAICAARVMTRRTHVMVFDGAYHGGVLYFASGANPINAPFPYVIGTYNDLGKTLPLIEAHADELAVILVEPMQGAGGCIAADPEFLQGLRDAADRHGIVLIFDEVMTSRLSPGGLQGKLGVTPDMTSFGKYIGGGMTFGAFGGRKDIMDQFDPRRADALPHAGTFNNNMLTMAAGATGLKEIYTPETALAHNARGDAFREELNARIARHDVSAQAIGIGSLVCIHFHRDPIKRVSDVASVDPNAGALLHLEMMGAGFYLARRGFMSLSLPLTDDDYTRFADAFDEFLATSGPLM